MDQYSKCSLEQARIIEDILTERKYQDHKHGGPVHDDLHSGGDFLMLILKYIRKAVDVGHKDRDPDLRRKLIQVAALAVAAVESFDRYAKKKRGR